MNELMFNDVFVDSSSDHFFREGTKLIKQINGFMQRAVSAFGNTSQAISVIQNSFRLFDDDLLEGFGPSVTMFHGFLYIAHKIHVWYIYLHENHKNQAHVGKYSIHGWYGLFYSGFGTPLQFYIGWDPFMKVRRSCDLTRMQITPGGWPG